MLKTTSLIMASGGRNLLESIIVRTAPKITTRTVVRAVSKDVRWPGGRNVQCGFCNGNYTVEKEPNQCPYCGTNALMRDVEGVGNSVEKSGDTADN